VVRMVADGEVEAVDGSVVPISVRSICVHGDTPDAVRIAQRVRQGLADNGVTVRRFTSLGNGSPTEGDSPVETTGRW
jgi:5-oxoprolinase (ATP-hydrolysing) subunit A